jgi:hypothetical protein
MKKRTVLRFFSAGFLPALRVRKHVEQQPTDSGKILCRKHTMANASLSSN